MVIWNPYSLSRGGRLPGRDDDDEDADDWISIDWTSWRCTAVLKRFQNAGSRTVDIVWVVRLLER